MTKLKSRLFHVFTVVFIGSFLFISCIGRQRQIVAETSEQPTDSLIIKTDDEFYRQAYTEIDDMLEGRRQYDFKRAVFLLEWAYLRGSLDYGEFCNDITTIADNLKRFIKDNRVEQYKTAGNFALFEYFTKPNWMNGNKPFTYDFEDFLGDEDYTKLFVTKLMRTHSGQCRSLPIFYKILSDEIGAESYLAQAPNHMYIKHLGEDNKWVNVELTNGNFASDAYIVSSMAISAEAIRNRIYMDAMSEEENLAFILHELTLGYERLYGYDDFVLQCCNKSLEYYPHNMPALFAKNNALLVIGFDFPNTNKKITAKDTTNVYFREWKANHDRITALGFRDMPRDLYLEWVRDMEAEKERQKQEYALNK